MMLPGSPRGVVPDSLGASMDGSIGGGGGGVGNDRPMVLPCLDNLELPYADDSAAVTPTSEDLFNFYNTQHYYIGPGSG